MIAPRAERRGLRAARPVLVVGMAPSRAGHDLDGPTFLKLARHAGTDLAGLSAAVDLVNLLPQWPGEAGSAKWDATPDRRDWAVGQRASLLYADLLERPRRLVVGLGDFVRQALGHWWGLPDAPRLTMLPGVGGEMLAWSPHPAGTNMWWNDPANLAAGELFWSGALGVSHLPRPPVKVSLAARSRWLAATLPLVGPDWPGECVDWPFVDPPGRPQALLRGRAVPAAQAALELTGRPKPERESQALHSCDRGPQGCVNPGHLRWGTELENRVDQVERRIGTIGRVGLEGARDMVARFEAHVRAEAERYGCSQQAVRAILLGKSWNVEQWETGPE